MAVLLAVTASGLISWLGFHRGCLSKVLVAAVVAVVPVVAAVAAVTLVGAAVAAATLVGVAVVAAAAAAAVVDAAAVTGLHFAVNSLKTLDFMQNDTAHYETILY